MNPTINLFGILVAIMVAPPIAIAAAAKTDGPADQAAPAPAPDRQEVIRYAAESGKSTWQKAQAPTAGLASRELFTYALALAEAKMYPERLEALFNVGAQMQDRDAKSRGYGNFRWSWSHTQVMDYNAVEFCMQGGALLWMRHRDTMPAAARDRLRDILDFAVEGCLRHKVRESYTNIALMNAENLILLGESLDKPKVADEGYTRLDRVFSYTFDHGIAEYGSPTYYGVDLDCLVLIEAFAGRETGRQRARSLLNLFWTDIALNYFPPSERLGGPHSRDYDYLRGHGILETHLWMNGWIGGAPRGSIGAIWPALGRWQPRADLYAISRSRFPRLVRQSWGPTPHQSRTHYLARDVTLGSAGANYHNMDLPLTVDLPGDADFPRCYFIPDARHDPYGKEKIPEGSGAHSKTLHLRPFWTAVQRKTDALGVVLYRDEDMTKTAKTIESHFVMPRDVDGFWVDEKPVRFPTGKATTLPLKQGQMLVLRKGSAAVAVRVVGAWTVAGKEAEAALVDDGNKYGVVRLTVTHYQGDAPPATVVGAGAALHVCIGSGLKNEDAFADWSRKFMQSNFGFGLDMPPRPQAGAKPDPKAQGKLDVKVGGIEGPLEIEVGYPGGEIRRLDPPPSGGVLELDGQDIGRNILNDFAPTAK